MKPFLMFFFIASIVRPGFAEQDPFIKLSCASPSLSAQFSIRDSGASDTYSAPLYLGETRRYIGFICKIVKNQYKRPHFRDLWTCNEVDFKGIPRIGLKITIAQNLVSGSTLAFLWKPQEAPEKSQLLGSMSCHNPYLAITE